MKFHAKRKKRPFRFNTMAYNQTAKIIVCRVCMAPFGKRDNIESLVREKPERTINRHENTKPNAAIKL